LSYNFLSTSTGGFFLVYGYNDKLHVFLERVSDRIRNLQVLADRLEVMKEQAKREWENFFLGQTYRISDYYGRYLLNEKQWTIQEKLAALSSTYNGVSHFIRELTWLHLVSHHCVRRSEPCRGLLVEGTYQGTHCW
jgi:secreted Zn-dependent insulinase-like peptidase